MKKRRAFAGPFVIIVFMITFAQSGFAETVRERASLHFSMDPWSFHSESLPHTETAAIELPGGNESFAVLRPSRATGVAAIYPEAEGLGSIEYSGLSPVLESFLRKIADSLQLKDLAPSLCSLDRPFIAPLTVYRLEKLPNIAQVFFSKPETVPSGLTSIRYRLTVKHEGKPSFVFLSVLIMNPDTKPVIDDIVFDGVSYADVAQQD